MISEKSKIVISCAILVLSAVTSLPSHATSFSRTEVQKIVLQEAMNSIVPPALALAVAKVESDFNANALSSAGARGVMQIMPRTARDEFGVNEDELWEARLNIQLGIDYLGQLYRQYGGRWDLALSHYNGGTLRGSGRHAKPHGYTRKYVQSVQRWRRRYQGQADVWASAQLDNKPHHRDGWEPARTKVKALLRESVKRYRRTVASRKQYSKSKFGNNIRVKFETPASLITSDARRERTWMPIGDDFFLADRFDESFIRRLERAKRNLDDFGPSSRHKRS